MSDKETQNHFNNYQGLEMYFSREIAEKFAELEQNEKNFRVAEIVDRILMQETVGLSKPIQAAELGGGAHPDRYHKFFNKLIENPRGHIDWVDISPYMLELAEKYIFLGDWKGFVKQDSQDGETTDQDVLILTKK